MSADPERSELEARVRAVLEARPTLALSLAPAFGVAATLPGQDPKASPLVERLASAIVEPMRPVLELVMKLRAADERLERAGPTSRDDRDALLAIASETIPHARDFELHVAEWRANVGAGRRIVVLPYGTLAFAEGVLARLANRRMRLAPDPSSTLPGSAATFRASLAVATVDRVFTGDGRHVVRAVVNHLAERFRLRPPGDDAFRSETPAVRAALEKQVEGALLVRTLGSGDDCLPHFFFLDDPGIFNLLHQSGEAVLNALRKALPSLGFLRLENEIEGFDRETAAALFIAMLWQRELTAPR